MDNSETIKKKKKIKIIFITLSIFLILLALATISLGVYLNYLSKPKIVVTKVIDTMNENIKSLFSNRITLPDSNDFTMTSTITTTTNSVSSPLSNTSPEYQKFINNLTNTEATITLKQDATNKKLLLEYDTKLKKQPLLKGKYLITDATEYYFIDNYVSHYINNGSNNYFENLSKEATTEQNSIYLATFIINSFKNNLKEDYIHKYTEETSYLSKTETLTKLSIKFDNKIITEIAQNILKDLKNDAEASRILTNLDSDFKNTKIKDNTTFLNENESITFNIYTDKLNNVKKIELINLNNNTEKRLSYEISDTAKIMYFIENDQVSYILNIKQQTNYLNIDLLNNNDQKLGSISLDNTKDTLTFTVSINSDKNKEEFSIQRKFSNVTKTSYNSNTTITIKEIDNNVDIIDSTINIENSYSTKVDINEDLTDATLANDLLPEEKTKIDNIFPDIINKLSQ